MLHEWVQRTMDRRPRDRNHYTIEEFSSINVAIVIHVGNLGAYVNAYIAIDKVSLCLSLRIAVFRLPLLAPPPLGQMTDRYTQLHKYGTSLYASVESIQLLFPNRFRA